MVTMEDIAIELGCSINTVSKALNNKPDVSEQTRKKVLETAKRMGYVPNSLAKSLVTKISGTIGIVVPSVTISVYTEIVEAIMTRAAKLDYSTFLAISAGKPETEALAIENLYRKRVDGLIIIPVDHKPLYHKSLKVFELPIVYVLGDTAYDDSYFVGIDLFDCACITTQHLIDNGSKRIALVCSTRSGFVTNIEKGFKHTILNNGLEFNEEFIFKPDVSLAPQDAGYEVAHKLDYQINNFDGIILEHEFLYFGLHRLLEQHGLSCPNDILVAACLGIREKNSSSLSLTSIDISPQQIGYDSLSMLMDLIKYNKSQQNREYKIKSEPRITIRKSSKRI
ncbi:MAG: LacI family transcriptional regulator [Clostridiaceae bacterium]|nr:LacI family transcriptional regulator [Clostridiaceae bacterium]